MYKIFKVVLLFILTMTLFNKTVLANDSMLEEGYETTYIIEEDVKPNTLYPIIVRTTRHIEKDYMGWVHFPEEGEDSHENLTKHPQQVEDTYEFEKETRIKGSLSSIKVLEEYFEAEFGFDISYRKKASRKISTTVDAGYRLEVFPNYKKYKIIETITPILPEYGNVKTNIAYVYIMKGVTYKTTKI